jgi:hypothetical protein
MIIFAAEFGYSKEREAYANGTETRCRLQDIEGVAGEGI